LGEAWSRGPTRIVGKTGRWRGIRYKVVTKGPRHKADEIRVISKKVCPDMGGEQD